MSSALACIVTADMHRVVLHFFFFFNDTATTEIYTLSLHDALPISGHAGSRRAGGAALWRSAWRRSWRRHRRGLSGDQGQRSEEHTSELQSLAYLVCRLLLEKKKKHSQKTHVQSVDTNELTSTE